MSTLSSISSIIVYFAFIIWFIVLLSLIYKSLFKKEPFAFSDTLLLKDTYKEHRVKTSIALLAIIVLFLAGNKAFLELIGHHSLEYENSGKYCYYVKIASENNNATYTLPGEIRVEVEYGDDAEGRTVYDRIYYVDRVYFDDGDYLDFTENATDVSLSGKTRLLDQNGKEWKCSIINKHAFCPQIRETTHVTTYSVIELGFILIFILYNWLGCMALENNANSDNNCKERK